MVVPVKLPFRSVVTSAKGREFTSSRGGARYRAARRIEVDHGKHLREDRRRVESSRAVGEEELPRDGGSRDDLHRRHPNHRAVVGEKSAVGSLNRVAAHLAAVVSERAVPVAVPEAAFTLVTSNCTLALKSYCHWHPSPGRSASAWCPPRPVPHCWAKESVSRSLPAMETRSPSRMRTSSDRLGWSLSP